MTTGTCTDREDSAISTDLSEDLWSENAGERLDGRREIGLAILEEETHPDDGFRKLWGLRADLHNLRNALAHVNRKTSLESSVRNERRSPDSERGRPETRRLYYFP